MKMKRCRVTVSSVCRLDRAHLRSPSSLRAAITTREGGREDPLLLNGVGCRKNSNQAREREAEERPLPPSFARIAPRKESFLLAFGGADDHDDDMMAYFLCLADTE